MYYRLYYPFLRTTLASYVIFWIPSVSPFKAEGESVNSQIPYQTLLKMDSVSLKMTHGAIVVVFFLSGHRGDPQLRFDYFYLE